MKKCKCCNREQGTLKFSYGFCYDCGIVEKMLIYGIDANGNKIEKREGLNTPLTKLQEILKIYGVYKP